MGELRGASPTLLEQVIQTVSNPRLTTVKKLGFGEDPTVAEKWGVAVFPTRDRNVMLYHHQMVPDVTGRMTVEVTLRHLSGEELVYPSGNVSAEIIDTFTQGIQAVDSATQRSSANRFPPRRGRTVRLSSLPLRAVSLDDPQISVSLAKLTPVKVRNENWNTTEAEVPYAQYTFYQAPDAIYYEAEDSLEQTMSVRQQLQKIIIGLDPFVQLFLS